jgi:hypothetical protein
MGLDYITILDNLGYIPIPSSVEEVLYTSIKKSVEVIGESYSKLLLHAMSLLSGLTEKELLTNYDLFEKSLHKILDAGADVIIRPLRKELLMRGVLIAPSLTVIDILNPQFTVNDILRSICDAETLDFVRKIPAHNHIIFLYKSESSNDKLLYEFFENLTDRDSIDYDTPRGLLSSKPPNANLLNTVSNILYDQLLSPQYHEAINRLSNWIVKLHSSNNSKQNITAPTRIAADDATWWLRNGFAYDNMLAEQLVRRCVQDNNIAALCCYNFSKLTNERMKEFIKTIITCHEYVILDEPYVVYKASQNGIKH